MKLPEPYTFFVDRSLGSKRVGQGLRAAGYQAEAHDAHFAQDTLDVDWMQHVGARGWVVLSKDKGIKRNVLEVQAIVQSCAAVFVLSGRDLTADTMVGAFLGAMRRMERVLRRYDPPFIAVVTVNSEVSVRYAEGDWLRKPRAVKGAPGPG